MTEDWLEIGDIVAPQGLKGQLRVNPTTDFPDRFEKPGQRWLQRQPDTTPEPVQLLSGYQIPGRSIYVIKLAEVTDILHAEALRGCKLLVAKSDRPQLPPDEYHVSDLINLPVYHQVTGVKIGVITAITSVGNDLLEVKTGEKTKVLIPFVKEIVPLVDLTRQRVEINPPIGLLELNDQSN
ncbi:ribosome maturation factor RimM [Gloeocapsa sp. PCC 73106]|uniref:ribosome maturation factor RimM n=1 Tax=Gloeocapsa sp. PCC 73106 TaxID=102232 RepID=UPI0002ABCB3D|nr:ribosome maturation factor RimM [Gloeocapsa sp. PCC 73106]ELR97992.1 16S rRNA processing protein RimM [Gloeocapsa sp. PCC 73106]